MNVECSRWFWVGLDRAGHHLPLLRFGRVRHWICTKSLEAQYPDEKFR
jgi:hypothetical protein